MSHGDGVTSFADARNSGLLGVIHKATTGATGRDDAYKARRLLARKAGLLWGAYHWGIAAPVDHPGRLAALAVAVAEQVWQMPLDVVLVEGFQHPSGPVIQVGPPKQGPTPGEVLATLPAVSGLNGDTLEHELRGVLETIRSRVRGGKA